MGKKKTKDVQFYVEVMEASYALDNHRRSGYDPDELEEEQRERALRNRMNQEFQNFTRKVCALLFSLAPFEQRLRAARRRASVGDCASKRTDLSACAL
eukprot:437319-Pleurochrysis_carterae.AAC.3